MNKATTLFIFAIIIGLAFCQQQPSQYTQTPLEAKMHKFATFIREEAQKYTQDDQTITKQNYQIYFHSVLLQYSQIFITNHNQPQLSSCIHQFVQSKQPKSFTAEEVFSDFATNFYNFLSKQNTGQYQSILRYFYPQQADKNKQKQQRKLLEKIFHTYLKQNNLVEEGIIPKEEYAEFLKVTLLDTVDQKLINADVIHKVENYVQIFIRQTKKNLDDVGLAQFVEDMSNNLYDFLLHNSDSYGELIELFYLKKVNENNQDQQQYSREKQMSDMTGLQKLRKIMEYYFQQMQKKSGNSEVKGQNASQFIQECLKILLEVHKQAYPYPGLYHDCVDDYLKQKTVFKGFHNSEQILKQIRKTFKKFSTDNPSKCYRFLSILFPDILTGNKEFYKTFQYREAMFGLVKEYSINNDKQILKKDYPHLLKSTLLRVIPIGSDQPGLLSLLEHSISKFVGQNKKSQVVVFNEIHEDLLSKYSLFLVDNVKQYYPVLRKFFYEVIVQNEEKLRKYEFMMIINEELDKFGPNTFEVKKSMYPGFVKNVLLKLMKKSQKQFGYTKQLLQYLEEFTESKQDQANFVTLKEIVSDLRSTFVQFLLKGSEKHRAMGKKLYPKMSSNKQTHKENKQMKNSHPDQQL